MKSLFTRAIAAALVCLVGFSSAAVHADIMNVDVTRVDARYRGAFQRAERFWETRIIGYSDALPAQVRAQLRTPLRITAISAPIDGAGGILGQAGPNTVLTYGGFPSGPNGARSPSIAIARTSSMQFDTADLAALQATGALDAVVRHEMAHAMGFGSLWTQNNLMSTAGNGQNNYVGNFGRRAYRAESGNTFAPFVPVEQAGGGGTAGAHWDDDDPFFNRRNRNGQAELMLGSIDPGNDITFVSETTWASMADLWFKVRGVNDSVRGGGSGGGRGTLTPRGGGNQFLVAIPEPSGLLVFGLSALALAATRRRPTT